MRRQRDVNESRVRGGTRGRAERSIEFINPALATRLTDN